jgi:phage tail sheath protein FI
VGALYWPRVKIVNPSKSIFGDSEAIVVAPSGYIAGIVARNDNALTEGPFAQPAGTDYGKPVGVIGLENDTVKRKPIRDLIFPKRINPISYMPRYGYFIDGARCLKAETNFPHVGSRRGVSHIEKTLDEGLQWVRHRNNTETLRENVESEVYAYLYGWMQKDVFASKDPKTAFFIDVSAALNPPSVVDAGKLVMRIGLATTTPAEFFIIKVTKDTRALQEELLGK